MNNFSSIQKAQTKALSNATYRRNTRRHYQQTTGKNKKKKWFMYSRNTNGNGVRSINTNINTSSSSTGSNTGTGTTSWLLHKIDSIIDSISFTLFNSSYYNNSSNSSNFNYYNMSTRKTGDMNSTSRKRNRKCLVITFFVFFSIWILLINHFAFVQTNEEETKQLTESLLAATSISTTMDQTSRDQTNDQEFTQSNTNHHQQHYQQQNNEPKEDNIPLIMDQPQIKFPNGAWANCTQHDHDNYPRNNNIIHDHDHDNYITVSCQTIQYRIHKPTFASSKSNIIIGILSSGGDDHNVGNGFKRRQSIRETWANHTAILEKKDTSTNNENDNDNDNESNNNNNNNNNGILFIVAGPFSNIQEEYHTYKDILWINQTEIYNGEASVLTYKTLSFIQIIYKLIKEYHKEDIVKYIFKTDDDSYIHVNNLHHHLIEEQHQQQSSSSSYNATSTIDYWGKCKLNNDIEPLRTPDNKWSISNELYPEPYFPKYCQGAGFALSWNFIRCSSKSSSLSSSTGSNSGSKNNHLNEHHHSNHIANIRFMPFEDVAVGLLAKRCNIQPTTIKNENLMNMYRFGRSEEVWRTNNNQGKMEKNKLPKPNMKNGRIVQHRIYDDWDMKEHHKIVMDETNYELESDVKWYYRPELEEGGERR